MHNYLINSSLVEKMILISNLIRKDQIEGCDEPSVKVEEIQEWLNVDRATAIHVVEVIYYLMDQLIVDEIIYQNADYNDSKLAAFWHLVLVTCWKSCMYYVTDKITKEAFENCLSEALQDKDVYEISQDEIVAMLLCYLDLLLTRIDEIVDDELFTLDVALAVADLNELTENEYLILKAVINGVTKKMNERN